MLNLRENRCIAPRRESLWLGFAYARLQLKSNVFVINANDNKLLLLLYLVQDKLCAYAECGKSCFWCQYEPAGLGTKSMKVMCLWPLDTSPFMVGYESVIGVRDPRWKWNTFSWDGLSGLRPQELVRSSHIKSGAAFYGGSSTVIPE